MILTGKRKQLLEKYPEFLTAEIRYSQSIADLLEADFVHGDDKLTMLDKLFSEIRRIKKLKATNQFSDEQITIGALMGVQLVLDRDKSSKISGSEKITCRKGCSACCSIRVDISSGEAEVIRHYLKKAGRELPVEKFKAQGVTKTPDDWEAMPRNIKPCGFLDSLGHCSIYDVRPIACRKYFVASEPKLCDAEGKVLNWVSWNAEILASAFMNLGMHQGSLPEMMLKTNE